MLTAIERKQLGKPRCWSRAGGPKGESLAKQDILSVGELLSPTISILYHGINNSTLLSK